MEPIRVLVCGALGKMGQEVVRAVSAADGMQVVSVVDVAGEGTDLAHLTGGAPLRVVRDLRKALRDTRPDVMVDFTAPEAVFGNTRTAIEEGVRPVIGSTGLAAEQRQEIARMLEEKELGGLVASNFAIGAVLMMEFARQAAVHLEDVEILEYHHDRKLDAPSGTALTTARKIAEVRRSHRQGHPEETELLEGARGAVYEGIPIHSIRLPGRVAHQEVIFGGLGQILTIRHDSIHRESFMPGVVLAVRRVMDKAGLVDGLEKILWEKDPC